MNNIEIAKRLIEIERQQDEWLEALTALRVEIDTDYGMADLILDILGVPADTFDRVTGKGFDRDGATYDIYDVMRGGITFDELVARWASPSAPDADKGGE